MRKPWTSTEITLLRKGYAHLPHAELERQFARSRKAIKSKASELGLKRATRWQAACKQHVPARYSWRTT